MIAIGAIARTLPAINCGQSVRYSLDELLDGDVDVVCGRVLKTVIAQKKSFHVPWKVRIVNGR